MKGPSARTYRAAMRSTAPMRTSLTSTDPLSPANDNNPLVRGSAEAGSTVSLYASADCSGPAAVAGLAAYFALPGFGVSVPDNSTTSFSATATDPAGNDSDCSAPTTYVEDSIIAAPPAGLVCLWSHTGRNVASCEPQTQETRPLP